MARSPYTLERIRLVTSIASSIAVPILIAVFGWIVQAKISAEGAKKDYVQIAVGILADRTAKGDEGLRKWAVNVLDKTAPVPFSEDVRTKLEKGELVITKLYFPEPLPQLMEPPLPLKPLPKKERITNGDLMENVAENYHRYEINALNQKFLQRWIRETSAIVNSPNEKAKSNTEDRVQK